MNPGNMQLEFPGELYSWRGPAPYHFIRVPDEECIALRAVSPIVSYGWGVIPVTVRIGESVFETSLFPKDGVTSCHQRTSSAEPKGSSSAT